jgi:hypothetical protein
MTNRKDHDPRTNQPEIDDDTTGHASRYGFKAMPTDDTQGDTSDDDTEGHSGLGYHRSGLDDDATGTNTLNP